MAAVDVLMPMRDAAATVAEAWADLRRQSFGDWRLIAVDDGSRDGTAERLLQAAGGDRRLRLLRRPRAGIVAALQAGLAEASAPWLLRMDADDRCHRRRIERLLRAAAGADRSVASIGSRLVAFPRRAVSPSLRAYLRWQNGLLSPEQHLAERFIESTLAHGTALLRTEALREAGGWRERDGPEDHELWLRLQAGGWRLLKVPEVLYAWRRGHRSETGSARCSPEAFHRVRARYLLSALREAGARRVGLLGVGEALGRWERTLREAGFEPLARPWKGRGRPPAPRADALLLLFSHPRARARARQALREARSLPPLFWAA